MRRIATLVCLCIPIALLTASHAFGLAIYQYDGNDFTNIIDSTPPAGTNYTTSQSVDASFTLLAPLAPNLGLTDIRGDVVAYEFRDGANVHTESDSSLGIFSVATDAAGNVVQWQLNTFVGLPLPRTGLPGDQRESIQTTNIPGVVTDRGFIQECSGDAGPDSCGTVLTDLGSVSNAPGTWTFVPEPGTALLLAGGLAGLAWGRKARR